MNLFTENHYYEYMYNEYVCVYVHVASLSTSNEHTYPPPPPRALIFTQMGRVLDVLEIFLNYHGHTYLRLDGSTPVIKRQVCLLHKYILVVAVTFIMLLAHSCIIIICIESYIGLMQSV